MKHVKVKRGKAFSLALAASLTAALGVPAIALAAEDVDPAVQVVEAQGASAASFGQNGLERSGEAAATVGGVEYATLNEALAAATDGQTVKVLTNTTMTTGRVDGISITLDLNGCTVEADNRAFNVVGGGTLSYLEREGDLSQAKCSPRMKRFIKKASQASGVQLASASIDWKESPASYAAKHRMQAVLLVGMDGYAPARYAQANDMVENIDSQSVDAAADFVVELLKNI